MTKDAVAIRVIGKCGDIPCGSITISSIMCFMSIKEIMHPVVILNRAHKERR